MRTTSRATACLPLFLLAILTGMNAQTYQNVPKYQFGAGFGTFVYTGDLTPSSLGSYKTLKPALQLFASKLLSPSLAVRINLAFGKLEGDESRYDHPEYRQQRNFYFTSPVTELTGLAEWNILARNYTSRGFAPYLFGGVGVTLLNIRRDWSRFNASYFGAESELVANLAREAQQSLPRSVFVVPVGAGIRYYFSDKIGISAETSYRLMSTDYLDGFGIAANPEKKDHYYTHTVGVVYRIGKKNKLDCPPISRY